MVKTLAEVAAAIAESKGIDAPVAAAATEDAKKIAASMLSGERKAYLLGNAAAHHPKASSLLALRKLDWSSKLVLALVI